jgi:glycosyltransferase involved in cell wall biosynthesis
VRLTYASRRAWPALGGIENYLHLFADVLAAEHDVQVLAQQVEDKERRHLHEAYFGGRFQPFAADSGVCTDPLRLTAMERVRIVPLVGRALARRVPGFGCVKHEHRRYGEVVGEVFARKADRPDLLHVMNGGNFAAAGAHARRVLGVPLVVTPQAHPGQWDDDELSGAAYRQADLVIANGEADACIYEGLGVASDRLAIVPPCTAPLPSGGGDALRRARGLDGPLVLFLGVRRYYKGHDILLAAAPLVARDIPDAVIAFVGPGPALPAPPEGARVLDVGPVDEDQKAAWLEAADVLTLPSGYESFGLAVAEAWSLGTPVVTSRAPALEELVQAAGGGRAVRREPRALAAALVELLRDPAGARALGAAGQAHWRAHHTPEATAARLLDLYQTL